MVGKKNPGDLKMLFLAVALFCVDFFFSFKKSCFIFTIVSPGNSDKPEKQNYFSKHTECSYLQGLVETYVNMAGVKNIDLMSLFFRKCFFCGSRLSMLIKS